jgi:hypothetical protein
MTRSSNRSRVRLTSRGTFAVAGAAVTLIAANAVHAQDMAKMPGMKMPPASPSATLAPKGSDDMAGMEGMDMGQMMTAALGPYPMTREASGTSWQPDNSEHQGIHVMKGDWMLMFHADLNGVYDKQSGPHGDEKGFVSGMVMAMAKRAFADGDAVQFRAMLSPEPAMGARGYPLLLASGETANGVTQLVDRQHPHDLFMELSASYSHKLTAHDSVFIYVSAVSTIETDLGFQLAEGFGLIAVT